LPERPLCRVNFKGFPSFPLKVVSQKSGEAAKRLIHEVRQAIPSTD